jgi:hypothetical protein
LASSTSGSSCEFVGSDDLDVSLGVYGRRWRGTLKKAAGGDPESLSGGGGFDGKKQCNPRRPAAGSARDTGRMRSESIVDDSTRV